MGLASQLGSRFKAAFTAEIVGAISGGALTILLARLLTPGSYGLLFLALSVFSVAKLFSAFGVAKSASRYIAEYKETDPGQIPHILRVALLLNLLTIAIIAFAFFVGRGPIATLLNEPDLSPFLLLGSAFIVFSTLTLFVQQTLQGFEEIRKASLFTAVDKAGRLIFATGFVLLGYGALGALVGYIVSYALIATVGLAYLFHRGYRQFDFSPIESGLKRKIGEYTIPIAVTQSAHTLDHHIDKVLIGFFVGPTAVGFYTIGKQVVQFVETPMSALGFTLSPTYGSQKARGNSDTAARIYETALSQGLLLYFPAAAGLMILAEPGIRYVFGSEYLGAVPVLQVLAIFAILQSVTKLTSHGLDYLGRARDRSIIKGATAVLNFGLNVVLIPIMGVVGAAVATVVTFAIYTFANVYIMHLEFDLRVQWLAKQAGYAVLITGLMSVVVVGAAEYISGLFTLVSVVLLGVLVWAVFTLYFDLVDTDRLYAMI